MKEFIKNKYNILLPICLIIVLLIAIFLYSREYKNNRYAEVKEVNVYQYFSGVKMEYTAKISRNKKNVILDYDSDDSVVNLDSTPIYIIDGDNAIFPKEMSIVFPLKDKEYKVNALAEIYMENDLYYLNIRNLNKSFDHIFYFDGSNLYFFVDDIILSIGNKDVKLSPMSYVSCSYLNMVEYYDKDTDSYGIVDITNESVIAKNDYMTIDVCSDKIVYKDSFTLLTKDFSMLDKVNDIEE